MLRQGLLGLAPFTHAAGIYPPHDDAPDRPQVLGYPALKTGLAWLATSLTALAHAGPAQIVVTRTSAKLVMGAGMALAGAGILWAAQVPAHGRYWANLAGPLFVTGGAIFAFITVSIGALADVADHGAGIASGLLNRPGRCGLHAAGGPGIRSRPLITGRSPGGRDENRIARNAMVTAGSGGSAARRPARSSHGDTRPGGRPPAERPAASQTGR